MPKILDHVGHRHGRLTAVRKLQHDKDPKKGTAYICMCDCGYWVKYYSCEIANKTKPRASCGFCNPSKDWPLEYQSYSHMLQRCLNPWNEAYPHYGGKGITVHEAWKNFYQFIADVGFRPSIHHSLDRIDPAGNYTPDNCRWIFKFQQPANRNHTLMRGI